jgi:hypothetical protein
MNYKHLSQLQRYQIHSLGQHCKKLFAFIRFKFKELADMALGDDQRVTGGDREGIPYDQPQRAGVNHSRLRQATK